MELNNGCPYYLSDADAATVIVVVMIVVVTAVDLDNFIQLVTIVRFKQ